MIRATWKWILNIFDQDDGWSDVTLDPDEIAPDTLDAEAGHLMRKVAEYRSRAERHALEEKTAARNKRECELMASTYEVALERVERNRKSA